MGKRKRAEISAGANTEEEETDDDRKRRRRDLEISKTIEEHNVRTPDSFRVSFHRMLHLVENGTRRLSGGPSHTHRHNLNIHFLERLNSEITSDLGSRS